MMNASPHNARREAILRALPLTKMHRHDVAKSVAARVNAKLILTAKSR